MKLTTRRFVRDRARRHCEYCRLPEEAFGFATFQVEHIRAKQHGGNDELENLAWACPGCNAFKGPNLSSVDPETDQIVVLFNPRVDRWSDHFLQVDASIEGVTASGRATVALLQMNEPMRVLARASAIEVEEDL